MELHTAVRPGTYLNELPHLIAEKLIEKLNACNGCARIVERINECFFSRLPSNISGQKLICELIDKEFTVGVLADLLEDLDLYEPLSALLKPEELAITVDLGKGHERFECDLDGILRLNCSAKGVPLPKISWWRDNSEISKENEACFDIKSQCLGTTVTSSLTLKNFSPLYQGKYFCVISSESLDAKEVRSSEVDVCVKFCKPVVTEHPQKLCVFEPESIILTCKAKGYPPPEYQWYFKNELKLFDQTESTLKIKTSNSAEHTGKYKCVVSNAAGSVESNEAIVNVPEQILKKIDINNRLKAVEKVALLIANEDGNLEKPINDIILLAEKLEKVGFKTLPLINLEYEDMLATIEGFSKLLQQGVYAVFYYAGHGCQRDSEILIPPYKTLEMCTADNSCCSAEEKSKSNAKWIADTYIQDQLLKNNPKIRIMILDMCLKYYGCPRCKIPVLSAPPSTQPDLNYLKACGTSKNLSSYESKSRPHSTYMTELSKYISPDMPYRVASIFPEVNKVISKKESNMQSESERQIPSISTNIFEDFTLLDPVIGSEYITAVFEEVSTPPEGIELSFENKEVDFVLKAQVKFHPYKKYILNSLVMVFDGVDFDIWSLDVRSDKEILGMGESYTIVETDLPNEFVIHHLQKYRSGVNLSINLLEKSGNIAASCAIFIPQPLIAKGW